MSFAKKLFGRLLPHHTTAVNTTVDQAVLDSVDAIRAASGPRAFKGADDPAVAQHLDRLENFFGSYRKALGPEVSNAAAMRTFAKEHRRLILEEMGEGPAAEKAIRNFETMLKEAVDPGRDARKLGKKAELEASAPTSATTAGRLTPEISSMVSDLKAATYNNGFTKEDFLQFETNLREKSLLIDGSRRGFGRGSGADLKPRRALDELEAGRPISTTELSRIKSLSQNSGLTVEAANHATAAPVGGRDFLGIGTLLNSATGIPRAVGSFYGKPAAWNGLMSSSFLSRVGGTTLLAGAILGQPFIDVVPGDFDENIDRGPAQLVLLGKYGYGLLSPDYRDSVVANYEAGTEAGPVDAALYKKFTLIEKVATESKRDLEEKGAEKVQKEVEHNRQVGEADIGDQLAGNAVEKTRAPAQASAPSLEEVKSIFKGVASDDSYGLKGKDTDLVSAYKKALENDGKVTAEEFDAEMKDMSLNPGQRNMVNDLVFGRHPQPK
jgi:hypothetical protein